MFKQVASTSVAYDGNKQAYIVLPNLRCHSYRKGRAATWLFNEFGVADVGAFY